MIQDICLCFRPANKLQQRFNVFEFCSAASLSLNATKSKIVVFPNGGHLRDCEKWFYLGQELDVVSFYKYLGAFFTPELWLTETVNTLPLQSSKDTIFQYQTYFGYSTF